MMKILKIQKKLFIIVFILIFVFMIMGIIINYLLLENFYLYKTEKNFISMSKDIEKGIKREKENQRQYLIKYGKERKIRILILDKNLEVEETSYYHRKDNSNIPFGKIKKMVKEQGISPYICRVFEKKNKLYSKIICISYCKNGNRLVLMKNTNNVKESVIIANEFYFIVGMMILIMALLVISIFSKKITMPIITMRDITAQMADLKFERKINIKGNDEIKELAESINQMSEKLQNSVNYMQQDIIRRKQLVRDLSHELKTPIAVIKGYADGLQYGIAEDKISREKYCKVIVEECDKMDHMVKELLELSKLEQVMIETKIESIKIYAFLEEILEKYEISLEQKKCNLLLECDKNIIIKADCFLLERIMENLIGNALKYVEYEGKIVIMVKEFAQKVKVSIFNSGDKIAVEELEKVWDVFYKIDKSRKGQKSGGHGIGLAIVKSAVELMGGNVFAENKENGVVFGYFL